MKKQYIKPKNISLKTYKKQLQSDLGAILVAEKADSEVNGYINTKQDGEGVIVEVVLYDKNEPANYKEGVYGNKPYHTGHKSNFKKIKGNISKKLGERPHDII